MRRFPAVGVITAGILVGIGAGFAFNLWSANRPIVLAISVGKASGPEVRGLQIRHLGGGGGSGPIYGKPMGLPILRFVRLTLSRGHAPAKLELDLRNSHLDARDVTYRVEDSGRLVASENDPLVLAGHRETRSYEWVPSDNGTHTLTITTRNKDFAESQNQFAAPLADRVAAPYKTDWLLFAACAFYGGVLASAGYAIASARRRSRREVAWSSSEFINIRA